MDDNSYPTGAPPLFDRATKALEVWVGRCGLPFYTFLPIEGSEGRSELVRAGSPLSISPLYHYLYLLPGSGSHTSHCNTFGNLRSLEWRVFFRLKEGWLRDGIGSLWAIRVGRMVSWSIRIRSHCVCGLFGWGDGLFVFGLVVESGKL
eukprot:scaffold4632_cov110-Isochrysis_galbana.AAC.4